MTTIDNLSELNAALEQRGYAVTTLAIQEEMCWWWKPTQAFETSYGYELFTDDEFDYIKITPPEGGVTELHQVLEDGSFSIVKPKPVERKISYDKVWMNSDPASMSMYLGRGFLLHDPDAPGSAKTSLPNIHRKLTGPSAEQIAARIVDGTENQTETDSESGSDKTVEKPKASLGDFLDWTPDEVTPDIEQTVVETPPKTEPKFRVPCMAKKGCKYEATGDDRSKVQGAYNSHVSRKHKAA